MCVCMYYIRTSIKERGDFNFCNLQNCLDLRKNPGRESKLQMAAVGNKERLPPVLDSSAEQPPLFDGTTRLYMTYTCPYAQRVWIARNYKGLQEEIKLVPLNLRNSPTWYKDKVYPTNKVPSFEHNGKVVGESLDLIKYVDINFQGPSLFPNDPAKREFAEEMLSYSDEYITAVYKTFTKDAPQELGALLDYLETALQKFQDGPFFLGQFSLVDVAYIPFIERFQIFLSAVRKYDIGEGRPKLAAWIEEMNKIEAYNPTKCNPDELVKSYKTYFV
ncbi:glutathione S-transferase L3-like [Punica granatum]|uniref:glutathione transferase n=1 Tax=Punica granatum TaxID=22663 RepID=A0A6P8CY56_PUNGR|nr:glutathione S-transferase L3-like [Punica granatum]